MAKHEKNDGQNDPYKGRMDPKLDSQGRRKPDHVNDNHEGDDPKK